MKTLNNLAIAAVAFIAASSQTYAVTSTWSATSSGNWSTGANWGGTAPATTGTYSLAFGSTTGGTITATNDQVSPTGTVSALSFSAGATSFILAGNAINLNGTVTDSSTNAQTISLTSTLTGNTTYNVVSGGTLTDSGVITSAAARAVTKSGLGTLVLANADTYTGTTTVNQGTLALDFSQATSPVANILNTTGTLVLGGSGNSSTLNIIGKASTASTQTLTGLALSQGASFVTYNPGASGTTALTITGTLSPGNATHGTIQFGTNGATNLVGNGTTAVLANADSEAFATYGTDDYAATASGVVGAATYLAASSNFVSGGIDNITASFTSSGSASAQTTSALRFASGTSVTVTVGVTATTGGILVASTAASDTLTTASGFLRDRTSSGQAQDFYIFQNSANAFTLGVAITGQGTGAVSLVKSGSGTVINTATQVYTGGLYINQGIWQVGNGATAGALGTGGVFDFGGLTYNLSSSLTDANVISGTGSVTQMGSGTLTLGGANTYTGATAVTAGVLTGTSTFINGSSVATSGTGVVMETTAGGVIAGAGSFTQGSSGTSTLAEANTYTGGTVINAGTLNINGFGAIGSGSTTLNGGTLQYASGATGNGSLDISTGTVTIGSAGGTIDLNGNSLAYASSNFGNGGSGSLTLKNSGSSATLTISGSNTYSGGTSINSGVAVVASNTTGSALGSGAVAVNGSLSGTGSVAGTVTVNNGASIFGGSSTLVGTLTVGGLVFSTTSSDLEYINASNSTASLIAVSSGGVLTLTGGVVNPLSTTGGQSTATGTYNIIAFSGGTTPTGSLSLVAAPTGFVYGLSNNGSDIVLTITLSGTPNIWNGAGTATGTGGDWNTTANWSSTTAAGGPNAAGANVVLGVGTTNVSTGGNVNISTSVTAGSLTFNNSNSFTLSASAGQSLMLNNSGATGSITLSLGNHTISAPIVLVSGVAATVGSGETLTWSGPVSGTGTVSLAGAGSYNVSGTMTNSGDVTIGNSGSNVISGKLANTGNVTINGSSANNISGTLANSGTLVLSGSGTTTLASSNSYGPAAGSVGTVYNSGLLKIGNNNALSTGDVSVTGNNTILPTATGLTLGNSFVVTNATTTTFDTNGNTLTLSGKLTDNGGAGAGTGSLTVASTTAGGTLILTGTGNNYGGATAINSGATLQLGNATSGGSVGSGMVTNSGSLVGGEGSGINVTVSSVIAGTGSLTQSGSGTLTLNAANTFTGTTSITGGTLLVKNSAALQSSTVNLTTGGLNFDSTITTGTLGALAGSGNLVLANNNSPTPQAVALNVGGDNASTTYTGNLSGAGSLTKTGTGTMTLTGSNAYGATSVNGGVLLVTGGSLGASSSALSANTGGNGFQITGGTVTASTFSIGSSTTASSASISGTASGSFTNTTIGAGGVTANNLTINTTGTVALGAVTDNRDSTTTNAPSTGSGLIIQGGTVTANSVNLVGNTGHTANLNLTGGSLTISAATGGLQVGTSSDGGFVSVSGGTLTYLGTDGMLLGNSSTNLVANANFTGGTTTVNSITLNNGSSTTDNGTVTLNGANAVLYLGVAGNTGAATSGIIETKPGTFTGNLAVNLNNGTLGASGNWTTLAPINLGGTAVTIQAANASGTGYNISLTGPISGGGGITKTGSGTLVLSGTNSYSGVTTINAGTVQISGVKNLGGGNYNTVTFNGGTLQYATGSSVGTDISTSNAVSILAGGATIDTNGNAITYVAPIGNNGSGGLTLADSNGTPGSLTLGAGGSNPDQNTYTGTTTIAAGTLFINEVSGFGLINSSGVNLTGSTAVFDISEDAGQTINDLAGVAGSTINLGGNMLTEGTASSTTYAGSIIGTGGSLYKQGTGTFTLSGASSYSGATTVSAGKFRVTGTLTNSVVTVGNGLATSAVLSGNGSVGGLVTSTSGSNVAYVAPGVNVSGTRGDFGTAGTLNVGNLGFTIGAGTQFDYDLSTANTVGGGVNDLITMNGGTLTVGGTGIVFNLNALSTLSTGVEYTLINGAGSVSGFSASDFSATGIGSNTAVFSISGGSLQVELLGPAGPNYYYNGSTSTDFTVFNNYSQTISGTPQTAALSSTSNVFISANSPSNNTPVVNSNVTINTLTFNGNGAGATISGTGTVTLAASGGTGITDAAGSSTGTETISAGVALGSNQSWASTANSTLRVSGSISGPQSLTLTGAGTYRLSGSNTFSGLTVGTGSDTPTVYLANTTSGGSATGTTTFTVNAGATIGGKGTSSGTSFSIAGTGTATAARANVLVGQTSLADTNTTGVLTLTASGASTIQNAKLTFNLNAAQAGSYNSNPAGSGTELAVGNTAITFGSGQGSVQLALNLQNEPAIVAGYTPYVLIAGTLNTGGTGVNGSQYSGLTLGTQLVNSGGVTETIITGNNLQLAFGSAIDQSFYGANSYLVLYQSSGVDDIDVVVVPEPGTWAMMLGGLAALIFWQRSRRRGKN